MTATSVAVLFYIRKFMNKYYSIASGSKGNCGLLIADKKILIDVGVSYKYLNESLKKHQLSIDDIDFVLITHEHSDHVKGLPMLCKNTKIPVYITKKSFEAYNEKDKLKNIYFFTADEDFVAQNVNIQTFKTMHDSVDSVGFVINTSEISFGYVTDLGCVSQGIFDKIKNCDMVVLESNYDHEMLVNGFYPPYLKRRILSTSGHLSNDESSQNVIKLLENGVKNIVLAHLSENNNTPEIVSNIIEKQLNLYQIDAKIGEKIHIAPIKNEYPLINI